MIYAFIYTFGNVLEQMAIRFALYAMHPLAMVFYFYVFSVIFAFGYAKFKQQFSFVSMKQTFKNKWAISFVFAESIGTALWFLSLYYLGLSGMAAFAVISKIFKMYYGVKVLGETLNKTQIILAIGTVFAAAIFAGTGNVDSIIGTFFAVCMAFAYTVAGIAQKHIAGHVPYGQIMLVRNSLNLGFVAVACAISFFMLGDVAMEDFNINALFIGGLAVLALYGGVFLRLMKLKSNEEVPLSTLVVIYEANAPLLFIAGFLMGDILTLPQGLAAGFMVFATLYFVHINRKNTRKQIPHAQKSPR